MTTTPTALALAMALLTAATSVHAAGYQFRVPLFNAVTAASVPPPAAAPSGAFALQTEIAGASGRASTFVADSSCRTALGSTPTLTFWSGSATTTGVSYNAGTGVFTVAALPSGGDGSIKALVLADSSTGNQCNGTAKVYSAAGWWPVTMSASFAADGTGSTSLTSPGFSATNSMCTGADVLFVRGTSFVYNLTGTALYTSQTQTSTVCVESVPEIAKAFSYTNGTPGWSWAPVGDIRTTINQASVAPKGNGVVLVDPWITPRVHLVTVVTAATSYRATGSVIANPTDPRYISYFTSWLVGQVDRDVPHTLAQWVADDEYWANDEPIRPLYNASGAWTQPNGEQARVIVHSVIP